MKRRTEGGTKKHWIEDKAIEAGTLNDIRWAVCHHPDGIAVNGYVQLPEGHPWNNLEGDRILAECHGSINYGPDEQRWIGFDTRHWGDRWEEDEPGFDEGIRWTLQAVVDETKGLAEQVAKDRWVDSEGMEHWEDDGCVVIVDGQRSRHWPITHKGFLEAFNRNFVRSRFLQHKRRKE